MADDKLLQAIEAAHAASLDAELWPGALTAVAEAFGATGASLEVYDKRTMILRDFRTVGLPDGAETPYVEYFSRHNPRCAYAMRNLSEKILYDYRLIDEEAMNHDAYYCDYLKTIGLRYFMTGQIVDTPENHGIISVQRSRRQGHVEKHELERMRRLLPHLCQAYEMTGRLRTAAATGHSLESALEWLSDGVALVLADGSIVYVNDALAAFARRSDGVSIVRGSLEFDTAEARARFGAALTAAGRSRDGSADRFPDFVVARAGGSPPYLVSVRPLTAGSHGGFTERAQVIVFIRDPLTCNVAAAEILRNLFGLTEAEANLAQAIQSGQSLSDYARVRKLSLNTVYTHLRRIKEKTQTKRQAELIHKLNSVQLPVRGEQT